MVSHIVLGQGDSAFQWIFFFNLHCPFQTIASSLICQSPACLEAGKSLRDSINFSVNPCDDFHQFTCGNWIAAHPIPDEMIYIDQPIILFDKIDKEIRLLFEHPESNQNSSAKSVAYALELYSECMDRGRIHFWKQSFKMSFWVQNFLVKEGISTRNQCYCIVWRCFFWGE